ncbi:AAA family ATPase [Sorangium sp. So ce131]|uniref:AAA family ATPase n=1 Tax=Sorangium sp. So ce131 TaxID=3133282 RepID=UPI003F62E6EB
MVTRDRPVSRETAQLRVAVAGTGIGGGKTHTSVALIAALTARGDAVCALKPIGSGLDGTSAADAYQLAQVSSVRPGPRRCSVSANRSPLTSPRVGVAARSRWKSRERRCAPLLCRTRAGEPGPGAPWFLRPSCWSG